MELKDVSSMRIASPGSGAPSPAPTDITPTRRYGFRHPNQRPYMVAAVLSAFWIGAAAAFTLGYLGIGGLLQLDWPWQVGLVFAVAFPVTMIWFVAHLSRRAFALQLASEDLLQIAVRLIEPDTAAGREIMRLGRAVRREIDALNAGLENALSRVRTLEGSVTDRLRAVEEASKTLEERGDAIRAGLREERENMAKFAFQMAGDAERLGEQVVSRGRALKGVTQDAVDQIVAAQDLLDQRAEAFRAALDTATSSAQATISQADRSVAALISASETLDGRLEGFLQRGERQRTALGEAVNALRNETQGLEQSMGRNLDALGGLGEQLAEQMRRTDAVAAEIARKGEAAAGGLGARTDAIAMAFAGHVERLDQSAAQAEERLKATTSAAAEAAEKVRTTFELAARSASTASTQTSELTASAMSAVTQAIEMLGSKTEEARKAASDAIAELKAEADALPALMIERFKEMRASELMALPAPEAPAEEGPAGEPPIVNEDGTPAAPTGETGDGQAGRPEWFGFARKLAGFIRKEPEVRGTSDWRLSTALANVDERNAPPPIGTPQTPVNLHKEALHVVEKLQALAIDLDRALGDDPAPDLWRRYVGGERSVFTRRLITAIGREGADKIAQRYAADTEFRQHADRYMGEFEGLLDDASARDRDQILVETFLTSQTGRLYLLLAAATGRL